LNLTTVYVNDIHIDALIDTGANCSVMRESIARRLAFNLKPCSLYITGIGNASVHIFATLTIPVRFQELCIELDVHVARDSDFSYDFLIGLNAVQHNDIEIIVDQCGCRLARKCLPGLDNKVNTMIIQNGSSTELLSKIEHLQEHLQTKISVIFEKYHAVLYSPDNVRTVKTGELKICLKYNRIIYYRPYRLAPGEKQKVAEIISDLLKKKSLEKVSPHMRVPYY
jgi:hypothetical protein